MLRVAAKLPDEHSPECPAKRRYARKPHPRLLNPDVCQRCRGLVALLDAAWAHAEGRETATS